MNIITALTIVCIAVINIFLLACFKTAGAYDKELEDCFIRSKHGEKADE